MLLIECPRLLFPFARRIVAEVTRDGGHPPLLIDPIDFVGLYRQQCDRVRDNGYEGFALDGEPVPLSGEDGQGAAVATAMAAAGA